MTDALLLVPPQHLAAMRSYLAALELCPSDAVPLAPYEAMREKVIQCPATSFELHRRVAVDAQRDPVDALQDAETLLRLARARADQFVGMA
jgi:hypothetical protein